MVVTEAPAAAYEGMVERLRAAGRAVRDASERQEHQRELRDLVIVEARDQGVPHRAIASAVGLAPSRIVAILIDRTGHE